MPKPEELDVLKTIIFVYFSAWLVRVASTLTNSYFTECLISPVAKPLEFQ